MVGSESDEIRQSRFSPSRQKTAGDRRLVAGDASSLHLKYADEQAQLNGKGARAYLDKEQIVQLAKSSECDAIHPGYGFLSENVEFARLCLGNGIQFIGPTPEQLALFGDGKGGVSHLWDRECTLQRQHQKLIEIAPSPSLSEDIRDKLISASMSMAEK